MNVDMLANEGGGNNVTTSIQPAEAYEDDCFLMSGPQ